MHPSLRHETPQQGRLGDLEDLNPPDMETGKGRDESLTFNLWWFLWICGDFGRFAAVFKIYGNFDVSM